MPFNLGFIGDVGSNAQQANNITLLASMGVSRIIFSQSSDSGQFQLQGNDIPGTLRLITSSGAVDVAGAIVWRWRLATGGEPYSLGFIPDENVSKSWTHNSTTYTITGLASDGSFKTIADDGVATSNIGVAVIGATFNVVNGDDVSGNAANLSSVLDSLNTYLATSGSSAPSGPVSVVSQTTNDSTPTVTGSVTLQSGEHLEVTINGVTYTTSNGLTVSGTTWSVTLPSTSDGTYNVDAEILNDDGFVLSDSTSSELIIDTVGATITGPGSSTGSTASLSVDEEQTSVFSFTASETVTWSITGGADSALFTVNSSTGVVTFSSAPDYENPGDSNTDNDYVFEITATDSLGNTTVQTVTVTVLDVTGSIAGTVTNARTGAVISGVTVKLYNSSNTLLATTTTDANGDYEFSGRSAGTYIVEFRPTTKAAKGRSDRGQVNGRYVESITISGEEDLTDVDGILIDPSGVVYDSDTRSPVENAVVQLFVLPDSGGSRREVLSSELDQSLGGVSGQTTGADGLYNFILNGSAPSGVYDIVVTPPATHIFESSEITKSSGPYSPSLGGGVETIQSQSTAPSAGEATTYYLSFDFTITATSSTSSNGVINNHIPVDPVNTQLTVTKTADTSGFSSPVVAGDIITYTITAENTGNVVLDTVSIADSQTPTGGSASSLTPTYSSGDSDSDSAIDVGETWTWTVSYTLTQSDIDAGGLTNLATVTVQDPSNTSISVESSSSGNTTSGTGNGSGTSTTLTASPQLTVTKTADSTSISEALSGDTISYTITVKNTGNVTFTSLSLTDALTSNEAWSASDAGDTDGTGALNVGETWTFTASYTITSSDITNGSVENVAYATGVPASGSNLTVYSGAQGVASTSTSDPSGGGGVITTLSSSASPQLTVTKTADTSGFSSPVVAGDIITYTITAENTGNVVLDTVSIADSQTPTGGSASSLTPTYSSGDSDSDSAIDVGETWTWTVSYTLTQSDIDAGGLTNLATVTVQDPSNTSISVESSSSGNTTSGTGNGSGTSTTLTASPQLTVTKTADSTSISEALSGDTISYTITVKNTGNVTFTSLSLTDALTSNEAWSASDAGDTDGTGALNVGETWTFTASYTITSSDITNGSVENVAYATGVPASGSNLTVYSGAQGVASTSTSDPSGGGGVITTLSRVNLISLIYDDLRDILSDDLAQTATQLSDQANSIIQGAFDRTRGYDLGYCADRLNQLLQAEPILFNIGSSELKAEADKILKDALPLLRNCPRGTLFVEGHKDAIGSPELNFRLGYARAKAVIDRLNQLSEFPTNLVAVEYGEDHPLAGSHSNAAENSNSHVVFRAKDDNHANCSNRTEHHGSSDGHAGPGVFTVNASGNLQQVDCSAKMARDLSWSVSTMDLDGNNDQLMISATFKQETGVETAYLRGWYLSAYHSGNDISNRATGDISGQGLAAGLYGVARRPSGLAFNYLLGAFAGQHDFDLDFSRTRGVISAKGHYRYFGANWRLGLSGETDVSDLPVRPQLFISGTNADAEAAKVTARRGDQVDKGKVPVRSFSQQRVTTALNFVDLLADPDLLLSLEPRGFCEDSSLSKGEECGYGIAARFEKTWDSSSSAYAKFDYEELDRFQRTAIGGGYSWQIEGGSFSSGITINSDGSRTLENRFQLSF